MIKRKVLVAAVLIAAVLLYFFRNDQLCREELQYRNPASYVETAGPAMFSVWGTIFGKQSGRRPDAKLTCWSDMIDVVSITPRAI